MTSGEFPAAAAVAAALAVAFPMGSEAAAQQSEWAANERGAVRLVSAVAGVGREARIALGVEIRLEPGWKTYWRVPGESGMPPRFDWSASSNLGGVSLVWPGPVRFTIAGMQSYGYRERVILPVKADLTAAGQPAAIRLHLRYAICREVCVPEEARLALDLGAGTASATPHAAAIAGFAERAPQPGERFGWRIERAVMVPAAATEHRRAKLVVEAASSGQAFTAPELVVEGGDAMQFGMSSAKLRDEGRYVRFAVPLRRGAELADAARGELSLTLLDGTRQGTFTVRPDTRR